MPLEGKYPLFHPKDNGSAFTCVTVIHLSYAQWHFTAPHLPTALTKVSLVHEVCQQAPHLIEIYSKKSCNFKNVSSADVA